jgi:HAD superfamily phosphatase (TIGR01668 family)
MLTQTNLNGRPRGLMIFCPRKYCHNGVTDVLIEDLHAAGIENVLLDLDNTLVAWQGHDIPKSIREWIIALQTAGIKLYLVSNTRHGRRLMALSAELKIPYVKRAWKPRKQGFINAMKDLGAEPSKTIMIGDQMFTDIWGGNRLGIYTIMVRPMARKEFLGTKISRAVEYVLLSWFRKKGHI